MNVGTGTITIIRTCHTVIPRKYRIIDKHCEQLSNVYSSCLNCNCSWSKIELLRSLQKQFTNLLQFVIIIRKTRCQAFDDITIHWRHQVIHCYNCLSIIHNLWEPQYGMSVSCLQCMSIYSLNIIVIYINTDLPLTVK